MSLPHALLTALIERPGSGLELAGRFDRSIGYFWQASHQQIYRELARLEAAGWVRSMEPDSGRGRRRDYRVLPAGRAELKRWVEDRSAPKPLRDELMVRLRAAAVLGDTALPDDLRQRLASHREMLANYLAIEARDFTPAPASRERRLRHLVLKTGIRHERSWIDVCTEALEILGDPAVDASTERPSTGS
ncbi:PadR family transcriptional regulator (plasmid) [Tistrella bauzanensis]|uniref:PadR family transcriptional regulator n=1 Tax=Tistrella arctica TaxID=3133430 RepID=A0ABU9YP93_9PROT